MLTPLYLQEGPEIQAPASHPSLVHVGIPGYKYTGTNVTALALKNVYHRFDMLIHEVLHGSYPNVFDISEAPGARRLRNRLKNPTPTLAVQLRTAM